MAEKTSRPKRRLIKKTETVRERAEKATVSDSQPRRLHTTKRRVSAPFRGVGRAGKHLGKFKLFRAMGLVMVPPYFRNSWKELKQVTWPAFPVSLRLTLAVFVFATVFGCLVALLDYGLDKVFKEVLIK